MMQHPPAYLDQVSRQTGALQQLQVIMDDQQSLVTLNDVAALVRTLQDQYGIETSLEKVIQALVGQQLQTQVQAKRQARQEAA